MRVPKLLGPSELTVIHVGGFPAPDVSSNLSLATFLIDRAKKEIPRNHRTYSAFERCRSTLYEIRTTWKRSDLDSSTIADAVYSVYRVMSDIERLMSKLSADSETYARLQCCINLLDEVDLIFETSASRQIRRN